jgi:predicted nucleic acid-binding protein
MSKVIISDTSCLIALSKIDSLNLLQEIYREVVITEEVQEEFGEALPDWIKVAAVKSTQKKNELEKTLDSGEASSIALALEMEKSLLIIDEIKGRQLANSLKIEIIGTVGILALAHKNGLIKDMMKVVLQLKKKGFHLSKHLLEMLHDKYDNQ